jgi:transcriptional regulator with XRE-family HTH domain
MAETVNQRIKQIRESLEMSQREFSRMLPASNSFIAGIETGARDPNDRLIKLICAQFGVSDAWLRTGQGEMFAEPQTDEKSARLLSLFNDLSEKYQNVIFGVIDLLREAEKGG